MDFMMIKSAVEIIKTSALAFTLILAFEPLSLAAPKPQTVAASKSQASAKAKSRASARAKTSMQAKAKTVSQPDFSIQNWTQAFTQAVQKNQTSEIRALVDFNKLETQAIPNCVDCKSKTLIAQARKLFSEQKYAEAELLYNQIPKRSDYWLTAVEERGWAHFRQDNFEKSIAQAKTLLSPQFIGIVNSEAFFLQSLSQLMICDYEGILATHQLFKEKQRDRLAEIQKLATTGFNESLKESLNNVTTFPLNLRQFGAHLKSLPSLFYRDIEVQRQILRIKISQAALSILSRHQNPKLYLSLEKTKLESANQLQNRVKLLAQRETEKNAFIIRRLNLVEVEAIQRIHTDLKLGEEMYQKNDFKKVNEDKLVFMDDGQPWIDELDKYDVAAKACARNIRRKM